MKIKLVFEGIFQSYGVPSENNYRATAGQPTKNAVIGLIGCCMGLKRNDERLTVLEEKLTVTSRPNRDSEGNPRIGTILTDYQTVTMPGGERLNSAEGGKAESNSIVLKKSYINDASFSVYIESDDEWLMKAVFEALDDPECFPSLGRKCCVPTVPLIPEIVG